MTTPARTRQCNSLNILREAAQQWPHAPALHHREVTWSYAQLWRAVDRLAAGIAACASFAPGDRVGVLSYKTPHSVAAMQSVLYAGGVYVMLDARQPASRLAAICRDAGIKLLLGDETMARHVGELREAGCVAFVLLDGDDMSGFPDDFVDAARWLDADTERGLVRHPDGGNDLAALLYTSGSTGVPKAVRITHENIVSFVEWADDYFRFSSDEVFLSQAHLSFDISTLDLYSAFRVGAAVVLLDEADAIFPRAVVSLLGDRKITNVYMVASALVALMDQGGLIAQEFPSLRRILYGGEVLPGSALRRLRSWLPPDVELFNVYGPIESNICTVWPVPAGAPVPDPAPIGYTVETLDLSVRYIDGTACVPGEVGEIWVSGPTVSPGYWQRPELDSAKFETEGDTRWYRTGDLGARDAEGLFSFHGRGDHLVKRRGFRIELGEIETATTHHPNIAECAVVSTEQRPGIVEIHAWCSAREGASLSPGEIRTHLAERIPGYMMPDSINLLHVLPKSGRDKIDRTALRAKHLNRLD
ncbi:amino acid adenylation domain-containing protein [Streptomyces sp. NPDC002659]|uniref:amino acid adenylation domain-containing protein n=1 Tax=Streptomyces sp. NPDC002659 TaxID=3364656 RepID=UPI0036AB1900